MKYGVSDRFLGTMFAGSFAMFQLLGLELGNIRRQLRIRVAKLGKLFRVMAVDLRFDGVGAGHRRPLTDQGRRSAEREAGDAPQRLKRGRPHPPIGHQPVEAFKMPLLLRRHPGDLVCGS